MQNQIFFLKKKSEPRSPNFKKTSSIMFSATKAASSTPKQSALKTFLNQNTRHSKQNLTTNQLAVKTFFSSKKKSYKQKTLGREHGHIKTSENQRSNETIKDLQAADWLLSHPKAPNGCNLLFQQFEQLEAEFLDYCREQAFESASQILVKLLNYSIDFNLKLCFLQALKKLSQFNFLLAKHHEALYYYNQLKQSSLLFNQPIFLIQSLIGLADCCTKQLLYNEAVIILKKGLEYAWLHNLQQYELSIYDKIGRQMYLMGKTEKAAKYHSRYIKAIIEKDDSPLKILSKQRLKKTEQLHIKERYKQINMLFLVHLSIPIKSTDEIPLLSETVDFPLRNQYDINKDYFSHYSEFPRELKKIMKNWFFHEEIEEPPLPQQSWTKEVKSKKFAHVDFKLNQKLKMMGIKPHSFLESRQEGVKYKQTLQEQIARKIKELPLDKDWYQKIVRQIKRDHKNKLLQVRSMIRVRGQNKITKPTVSQTRKIYASFRDELQL